MTITAPQVVAAYTKTCEQLNVLKTEYEAQCAALRATQEKREAWLKANLTESDSCAFVDPATQQVVVGKFPEKLADWMTQSYVTARDEIAARKKQFESEDDAAKDLQERRGRWLLSALDAAGAKSIKTEHGTFFVDWKDSATVASAAEFMEWVHEDWEERRQFLENRVSKTAVKARLDDGQTLPPGVNYTKVKDVKIRRN